MSAGPGTDIIGLLYSFYLVNKPLVNSVAFKAISRHGSWRNLVTEMMSSSIISVPDGSTCKLIECDFLKELSKKAQGYLKTADILLMCNSFSSSVTPEKVISNTLQRVIQLLKPGALVFFIDSKEKSTYFKEADSLGTFLFGPVEVTLENMPYNEKIAELVGVKPLCSGGSLFAVWQKIRKVNSEINLQKETENSSTVDSNQHSSAKLINSKSDVKDIKSQILSMSNLKREFSSDTNISSSDSIASSSQFSSSSISSKIIKRREKEPVVSDNSPSFSGHKIDFSKTNFNFAKNISPTSVNATDSLLRKKYAPHCGSGPKKKENNGNNMDSLLKNLEGLITKFEGLISSQDSSQNSHVKEKQSSSGQQCHQNMHQGHCRCSVKPCQFKGNGSTCCCHSMMCYDDTNHYCSTSVASNLYRILPQEGPCIVIPLQNLSNESLTHILSIVSQNCSSVNKTSTLLSNEENS
ncbi:hypothetical protein AVEN_119014-1 [Araneus ventricosus]|uniref:Uncharacterized protein n=1 Tax=Araneus ventricosus TaxID=182803 RepID=A0A4Y2KP59_ARAVE|nr:hypothetical protein AVEN_119014-1 [Araneus ventricosus]